VLHILIRSHNRRALLDFNSSAFLGGLNDPTAACSAPPNATASLQTNGLTRTSRRIADEAQMPQRLGLSGFEGTHMEYTNAEMTLDAHAPRPIGKSEFKHAGLVRLLRSSILTPTLTPFPPPVVDVGIKLEQTWCGQ
jgi:hypothetical protein